MKKFIILCGWILLLASSVRAETIYLRNGKIVQGDIVDRSSYHIVVKENGFPRRYYLDQIDRIEGPQKTSASETSVKDKKALILEFINVAGVRQNIEKDFEVILSSLSYVERQQAREIIDLDEIVEQLIPIYDKYYTAEDLQQMNQFLLPLQGKKFSSPLLKSCRTS